MTDQQTVAKTNEPPKADSAAPGAQEPTLAELLKEFDQSEPAQTNSVDTSGLADVVKYVRDQKVKDETAATREAIDDAVKRAVGDRDLPPNLMEAFLKDRAEKDHLVMSAFNHRASNPDSYDRVMKRLGDELADILGKIPDPNVTADKAAARAAVQGASTQSAPDELTAEKQVKALANMTIQEMDRFIAEKGFARD